MGLLRFLGMKEREAQERGDTESVRRIAAQLDDMTPDEAKYLAAFAYVLARVAHADLDISDHESEKMLDILQDVASLTPPQAELAVGIAKSQARVLGGTENYVVTREFRNASTRAQRIELLECLFGVAAADGDINSAESTECLAVAEELGFTRAEANAVRARYNEHLAEMRKG